MNDDILDANVSAIHKKLSLSPPGPTDHLLLLLLQLQLLQLAARCARRCGTGWSVVLGCLADQQRYIPDDDEEEEEENAGRRQKRRWQGMAKGRLLLQGLLIHA